MDSWLGRSVSLHSSPGLRAPLFFPCSSGRALTQEKRFSFAEAPPSSSFLGEILVHRLHIDLNAPPRAAPKLQNPVLAQETGFVNTGTKNRSKFKGKFRRFNFQAQGGDKVVVKVNKEESCYTVKIEVSSIHNYESLYMRWGLFRSSSSNAVVLDMQSIPQGTVKEGEVLLSQLRRLESGIHYLEFDLPSSYSPVFLTFSLYHLSDSNQVWIRNVKFSDFLFPVGFGRGETEPLGLTAQTDGSLNFSLYSRNAQNVILCLYKAGCTQPSMELELQSSVNQTGHIWHVELDDVDAFDRYGYRCEGESSWKRGSRFHSRRILLDPYAKTLAPFIAGQDSLPLPAPILGILTKHESQFDWEDDIHPNIPLEKIVAYRVHVTGFTAGKSSGLEKDLMGTFDGLLQKLQHFKNLGVNAIVLQPIFAFQKRNSYDPLSFFAPMDVFGPLKTSMSSSLSMKTMVKELHKNGIEVLLDVVYTHTGEGNDEEPNIVSFRGIDNATYYVLNESSRVVGSDSGASNRFNCNHPVVHSMILDSLRHWVTEYHVDGFCFANASGLTRGPHDEELTRPLLIEAISFDPLLSRRKLFADCSFLSKRVDKDSSFPHWKRWCLWNSKYQDDVRQFIRGDKGQLSSFATRLCGSGDMLADGRGPSFSLNHVTGPFGLTLVDLVSYSANIDGDLERSWNCGEEGRTVNQNILMLRVKQVRNFLMCLFLSQGIPVLNMGDEYGLTKGGSVSIDQRKVFNWDALNLVYGQQVTHLIASLAAFRERRNDLFQRTEFLKLENIKWHGVQVNEPDWESADSVFLAVTLQPERNTIKSPDALGDVYIAFNSDATSVSAFLPEPPAGMGWYRIADTSLPYPDCFVEDGVPIERSKDNSRSAGSYKVQSHSSILLEAHSLLSNC